MLFLLLLPLPQRLGPKLPLLLLLPVFFSGMDYLGIVLATGDMPMFPLRLEWWVPFSYSSFTGQLYWAPNHALALWLATVLFYRHWGHPSLPALLLILVPLLVIWTPFAVAGLMPFVGLAVFRKVAFRQPAGGLGLTWLQGITALYMLWITIRLMTLGVASIQGAPTAAYHPAEHDLGLKYALFCLMEFAILALLLARNIRHSHGLFWLATAILFLLPLYQFGPSNDAMLRLSTPCLLVIMLQCMEQLQSCWRQSWQTLRHTTFPALAIVLLIGAQTPFNEIWRALNFRKIPPNYGMTLIDTQHGSEPAHYVGRLDRADVVAFLRSPGLVPECTDRLLGGLAVEVPCGRIPSGKNPPLPAR